MGVPDFPSVVVVVDAGSAVMLPTDKASQRSDNPINRRIFFKNVLKKSFIFSLNYFQLDNFDSWHYRERRRTEGCWSVEKASPVREKREREGGTEEERKKEEKVLPSDLYYYC